MHQTIDNVFVQSRPRFDRHRYNQHVNSQLEEDRRTASHKLSRLITYSLLVETDRHTCCRCNKPLSADTFSIDHMENWLNSKSPRQLFFDIKNIDFSCKTCNSSHNRGKFGTRNNEAALRAMSEPKTPRKPLINLEEKEENVQTLTTWQALKSVARKFKEALF